MRWWISKPGTDIEGLQTGLKCEKEVFKVELLLNIKAPVENPSRCRRKFFPVPKKLLRLDLIAFLSAYQL